MLVAMPTIYAALVGILVAVGPIAQTQDAPKPKRIEIAITEKGFVPSTVTLDSKAPVELVFTRKTDNTCATEVAVAKIKVTKKLPLNEPVSILITPEDDEIGFACGMNMLKGKVVVK